MSKGELLSIAVSAALLWWVRVVTGEGAVAIIVDALPPLGLG